MTSQNRVIYEENIKICKKWGKQHIRLITYHGSIIPWLEIPTQHDPQFSEGSGFEPAISRPLGERSPTWANLPMPNTECCVIRRIQLYSAVRSPLRALWRPRFRSSLWQPPWWNMISQTTSDVTIPTMISWFMIWYMTSCVISCVIWKKCMQARKETEKSIYHKRYHIWHHKNTLYHNMLFHIILLFMI